MQTRPLGDWKERQAATSRDALFSRWEASQAPRGPSPFDDHEDAQKAENWLAAFEAKTAELLTLVECAPVSDDETRQEARDTLSDLTTHIDPAASIRAALVECGYRKAVG